MKKTIRLTESELTNLIKKIVKENNEVKENWFSKMFKKGKPTNSTPAEEIGFYEHQIEILKKKIGDLGYSYNRGDNKSYPKF